MTPRWWPVAMILAAAGIAVVATGVAGSPDRQTRVLRQLTVAVTTPALLLVWFLFFSRLRPRVRLIGLAGLLALALGAASALRVRGVTGDVMPILEWRWSGSGEPAGPAHPARGVGPAGADLPAGWSATGEYPGFLGDRRDGTLRGTRVEGDWDRHPPRLLWKRPIGEGWSGFAIAGGLAVTQEQRGPEEWVSCYDLADGQLRWFDAAPARFHDPLGGAGPRATPSIRDGRVFSFGATGILRAIDLETGRPIWSRDVLAENEAPVPTYGASASPLALDGVVVVVAGGSSGRSLVAYDRETGEPVWGGGDAPAAYSSPMSAQLAGERQILIFNERGLAAHQVATGRVRWTFDWPGETQRISQPVILPGDRVFVSTGYGVGGKLLRIRAHGDGTLAAEVEWESRALKAKLTNVVHRDGYLYGLDDGILACVDARSGERAWKRGRYGHGQLLLVEDRLLILAETGELALVEARPDGYRELARLQVLEGKTWSHPALAGRILLVRNDREAAAYELPVTE